MFPGELHAFHVVAKTGSIRKASEDLGVAPSSVSRKIALLEHQIGTRLFQRTAGGVVLTHAGTLVAEYARSVVLDYESLRTDLNDWRGNRRRLVSLAVVESALCAGLVSAVAAFRSRFEEVSFRLNTMAAAEVVEEVKRGACELGLTFCCPLQPEVVTVARLLEPVVLAVPNEHALSSRSSVTLNDLSDVVLALPDLTFGIRRILDRTCQELGLGATLNPAFSSNSFEALKDFVQHGAGVAVLPLRAVQRAGQLNQLKIIPIDHQALSETTIDIITLQKRRLPRVVSDFIQQLVETSKASGIPK